MTTYAFFRSISALCKTLDDATRFTGVSIQILVVYTGYLIRKFGIRCHRHTMSSAYFTDSSQPLLK